MWCGLNEARLNLVIVIVFAVVGAVLFVVGLILFLEGFDKNFSWLIFISGLGFLLAAYGWAVDSGFIEGKGTLASTPG